MDIELIASVLEVLIALCILALCVLYLITYGRGNYGVLEACGIPVVKPSLFLGSVPDFHNKVHHLEDIERFKKHGPIWGVYEGREPQVHVSDPELIRLIMVKDFDYFHNRRDMDFGSTVFNEILDYLPGEKWKTVRNSLTPLFTTSKLKAMSEIVASSAEEFARDLKKECEDGRLKIDCRNRMTGWLIDMFSRTTLGVQMENAKDPNNEFAAAFRTFMGEETKYDWLYSLSLTFPLLSKFAPTFDNGPTDLIEKTFRQVLDARRKSGVKKGYDFVDVLNELMDKVPSPEFKKLGITEDTVLSQAVNMFLGGYETSGTTSTLLLYYLAKNPGIQEKLQEEVDAVFEKQEDEKINHDSIREEELPFLTACINETLRLGPPLYRPERVCTKNWAYRGITIKKGTTVFIASWATHRNPKHFPDPDEFKPERFLPENKINMNPYAFTSFGHGPRACIGVRFAYESLKFQFCHLMRNFTVEIRDDTKLQFKTGTQIVVAIEPLYLDLVARE